LIIPPRMADVVIRFLAGPRWRGDADKRRGLRMMSFVFITVLSSVATYAAFAAGSLGLSHGWRLVLAIGSATVAGILTSLQVFPSVRHSSAGPSSHGESTLQRVPMQLPRDLRDFIGRSPETRWLVDALTSRSPDSSAVVISAIAGQGGVGKTTLALHVAHLVARQFPHGQIYVNLRGPESEALEPFNVLGGLLRDLGVPPSSVPDDLEERSRLFRSVLGRMHVLILLDNALRESQVRPLLPGDSSSKVLITCRAPLVGLEGIRTLRLNVMPEPDALRLLAEIINDDRITREPLAAREVARLCAYLPLAIRIVGSRLAANPHWRLDAFVQRLQTRHRLLDHLENGERAVRATLDISYLGLDPASASIFCSLGALTIRTFPDWLFSVIHPDGEEAAMRGLDALIQVDLLQSVGVDSFGTSRYGFHDLLREYSRERLEAVPTGGQQFHDTVMLTGAAFAAIAARADSLVRTVGNRFDLHPRVPQSEAAVAPAIALASRVEALEWFDSELTSLLLVVDQQVGCDLAAGAVALAHSLSAFCEERSLWREWESAQRCALAAAESLGDSQLVCATLYTLGRIHHLLGQWRQASAELNRSLQIARADRIRDVEAGALCALGKIDQLGNIDAALPLFEESRDLYREIGNHHAEAYVTANIGDIYHQRGEWDRALRQFALCVPIFQAYGDRWWEANAGIWIGDVFRGQGRQDDALRQLRSSLLAMRELGDQRRAAVALVHIGRAYADFGQGRPAVRAIAAALPTLEEVADRWWQALALVELGKAHALLRRKAEAVAAWQQALPAIEETGNDRVLNDVRGRMHALAGR